VYLEEIIKIGWLRRKKKERDGKEGKCRK